MSRPLGRKERVLVIGATSGIGVALCQRLGREGHTLALAARNREELERIAADLKVRFQVNAAVEHFDALDHEGHEDFVQRCVEAVGGHLDGVVVCHGLLPEPDEAARQTDVARQTVDVNFTSVISVLTPLAEHMRERGSGWIAVISSIAGDRGRQSNYVYGGAKAGLSAFLAGLRNRLHPYGVHVLTIKPGFVDTAMTEGRITPESPFVATPDRVAADIERGIRKRKNEIYSPWWWRPISWAVRSIPESLFKRLHL